MNYHRDCLKFGGASWNRPFERAKSQGSGDYEIDLD
jgi:hypothetical protein